MLECRRYVSPVLGGRLGNLEMSSYCTDHAGLDPEWNLVARLSKVSTDFGPYYEPIALRSVFRINTETLGLDIVEADLYIY